MQRKWMILAATMVSVSVLTAGFSLADDDEEGPLHQLMEKVNSKSAAVKKSIRTKVAFAKAQQSKDIAKNAEALIKLSKEARGLAKEGVKKAKGVKDPEKQWVELTDKFTAQLDKFYATASKPDFKFEQAKSAWGPVNQSCTDCHNVFRVESDNF